MGDGTHRPVLGAPSISGFGDEKSKGSWYIMTAHQSVARAGDHLAAKLCSAGAFSPSSPWADQATTLHPRLIAGSWPEEVLQKSEIFSILASPSKGLQPQTGVLQFSQVYFPRRSACSPLSPELQPRSVMNNVSDASNRCTSLRWTRLLSPDFPQRLSHSAHLDLLMLVTRSLVAACMAGTHIWWGSRVRGTSGHGQAGDWLHGSFHIPFPMQNWADPGPSTPPRVSLQGRVHHQVTLPQQQGQNIHMQWSQPEENMDLGMQEQLHQETEKAGSAPEELHAFHEWESSLLPPPGHLLWEQTGDFYHTSTLDAVSPGRAPHVRENRAQPF